MPATRLVQLVGYDADGAAVQVYPKTEVPRNADVMEMFAECQRYSPEVCSNHEIVWLSLLDARGREISGCDC